jgi:hypothetical protein
MANEISVNASIEVTNGNMKDTFAPGRRTYDQTAVGGPVPGYQTIGTSEETVSTSEISTLGWCMFRNLDATNYVRWGFSTGVYGGRMEAGETAGPFRLNPGTTIYMIANTAACKVQIKVYED